MRHCGRGRRVLFALLLIGVAGAAPAFADATVFAGRADRGGAVQGVALGVALQPVGIEFEYAGMSPEAAGTTPRRRTGMFNVLVGAPLPRARRLRLYGAIGGGLYREARETRSETNLVANIGGGASVTLRGPFGVRIDYRVLALRGAGRHRHPRRVYVGLHVAF